MTNQDDFDKYDEQIAEDLSDLRLSDDIAEQITPWKTAISQIVTGFILTSFTLSFFNLQYILPCIGILLMALGFRTLRRENRWFRASWILSGIRILYTFYNCVFVTTKLSQIHWLFIANCIFVCLLHLSLLFTFRMALRSAFDQMDEEPDGDPLLWAMIWYAAVIVLALIPLSLGWFAFLPMVVFYILIIRSLYRVGQNLDEWGYQVKAAPVFIGRKLFCILYSILILLFAGTGCVVSSHPVNAHEEVSVSAGTSQQAVRDHLIALGFPEEILADISDEDLDGMGDAIRCSYNGSDINFGGKAVTMTTAYAESPGGVLHTVIHFQWNTAPKIFWQDAIQIEPTENHTNIHGRILFDKKDSSYTVPLSDLKVGTGNFSGTPYSQILAKFSYPLGSSKQRGYVVYTTTFDVSKTLGFSTLVNFYHQTNPIVFPYMDILNVFSDSKYYFEKNNFQQYDTGYDWYVKIWDN